MNKLLLFAVGFLLTGGLRAQSPYYDNFPFTDADSLRGALRPERTGYDVTFYDLEIELDMNREAIEAGQVRMEFRLLEAMEELQFDLFANMELHSVLLNGRTIEGIRREHNAVFVPLPNGLSVADHRIHQLEINYSGSPIKAQNAPWDGGFVWARDRRDRRWMGVACEGTGASLWWPNKDHLSDEPDSMRISVTVPERYFVASNGNLRETVELEDERKKRYDWLVSYPINNYNVSITVGHYVHFEDTYTSPNGEELAMDYYVLDYNEAKARKHFRQSPGVLEAFEHYFGPYPFWKDGFALIETPYLGMEHQSGIAYGNQYMRGYLGGMIPRGMDWDYIIVHETGHEYFGNSISVPDHAEMWIHESFTTYMEALYVEYHHGPEAAKGYLRMQRPYILNREPILGPLDVNFDDWQGSDHYYKGSWMLHSLRHAIGDDVRWWSLLRGFYTQHAMQTVDTEMAIDYFVQASEHTWVRPFFEQYLRHPALPVLELKSTNPRGRGLVSYRWVTQTEGFAMPISISVGGSNQRIQPNQEWQELGREEINEIEVPADRFLIKVRIVD
ncbi:MAG: M1 family metallopeptidase [Bacteroidota bacterium]